MSNVRSDADGNESQGANQVKIGIISAIVSTAAILLIGLPILWLFSPEDEGKPSVAQGKMVEAQEFQTDAPVAHDSNPIAGDTTASEVVAPRVDQVREPPIANRLQQSDNEVKNKDLAIYQLERPGFHFTYDTKTGHLVVVEHSENQVSLYNFREGMRLVKSIRCQSRPTVTLAKTFRDRSYIIVGGKLEKRLEVFNASDGARIESVSVQSPTVVHLATSGANDDPYVYYAAGQIDGKGYRVGRIHLERMEDEGFLNLDATEFELSANGRLIYSRKANSFPNGFKSHRIVGLTKINEDRSSVRMASIHLEPVFSEHKSTPFYTPGPHNAYVVAGDKLYSTTLKQPLGAFDFSPTSFLAKTPWVFGVHEGSVMVGSLNDKRTVVQLRLSDEFKPDLTIERSDRDPLKWFFNSQKRLTPVFTDRDRSRVIAASPHQIALIPLKSLKLPEEPLLAVELETENVFQVGQEVSIAIQSFDDRIATRIHQAPKGMETTPEMLHWTPTDQDIGVVSLMIERRLGDFRLEQKAELRVERRSVPLPIVAVHVSLSPNGKQAVVWGIGKQRTQSRAEYPSVLLLDIATGKVKAVKHLERTIWSARVNKNGVYLLTIIPDTVGKTGREVLHLNPINLELIKSANPGSSDLNFELVGEDFLMAGTERFDQKTLEKISATTPKVVNGEVQLADLPNRGIRHLQNGWFYDGVIWNEDLTKPRLLIHPEGIQMSRFTLPQSLAIEWGGLVVNEWGGMMPPANMRSISQRGVRSLSGRGGIPMISPEIPVALLLEQQVNIDRDVGSVISVYELPSRDRIQSIILAKGKVNVPHPSKKLHNLDIAGDVIAACVGGKLYLLSHDEIDRDKFSEPFRFRPKQNRFVLERKSTSSLEYELVGGKPPYDVKLNLGDTEYQATGTDVVEFQIEGRKLIQAAIGQFLKENSWIRPNRDYDARNLVLDLIDGANPSFQEIVGRQLKGVPIILPVNLEALDRDLATARLQHSFIIELPQSQIVKVINDPSSHRSSTQIARAQPKRKPVDQQPDRERRAQLEKLNKQLAQDYAQSLVKKYPPQQLSDEEVDRKAKKALGSASAFMERQQSRVRAARMQGLRVWNDKRGHSTEAKLTEVFADQVVLTLASGRDVTVPIEKLSDADQEFIRSGNVKGVTDQQEMVVAQMQLLLEGFKHHVRRERSYPPAYIVDERGQPLLSWRVLILPHIGGKDLLELFHLDEPWNSPHNQKLLKWIPGVFNPRVEEVPDGKTTLLALCTENSVLSGGRPTRQREITGGTNHAALFSEVLAKRAVEWTRPDDLSQRDLEQLSSLLREHDGNHYVALATWGVRVVPTDASHEVWQKAIDRREGLAPDEFGKPYVTTLPQNTKRRAPLIRNDSSQTYSQKGRLQKLSVKENSPAGTVVGKAEGAPEGYFYSIERGNTGDTFEVHPKTGVITVKDNRLLDAEQFSQFLLQVVATNDRGDRAPITVTIVLGDENEPPKVRNTGDQFNVSEFASKSTTIGLMIINDAEKDPLTVKITSGNESGAFEIDQLGFIKVKDAGPLRKLAGKEPVELGIEIRDPQGRVVKANAKVTVNKIR